MKFQLINFPLNLFKIMFSFGLLNEFNIFGKTYLILTLNLFQNLSYKKTFSNSILYKAEIKMYNI